MKEGRHDKSLQTYNSVFLKEDSDQLLSVCTAGRTRRNVLNLQWEQF